MIHMICSSRARLFIPSYSFNFKRNFIRTFEYSHGIRTKKSYFCELFS